MSMIVGFIAFITVAVVGAGMGEQAVTGEITETPLAKVQGFLPERQPPGPAQCNNVNPNCK